MIQQIPVNTARSSHEIEVALGSGVFRLGFEWNWRDGAWSMSIQTRNRVRLVDGLKIVLNYELIGRLVDERLPDGFFVALDTTRRLESIGRFDLGDTVPLLFIPRADVEGVSP